MKASTFTIALTTLLASQSAFAAELDLKITNQGFETECTLDVEVIVSKIDQLTTKLQLLQALGHSIKINSDNS